MATHACVNVTDLSVGGGACRVVRLNERDHLLSAQLLDTLRDGVCEICLGHGQGVERWLGRRGRGRRCFDFHQHTVWRMGAHTY